MRLIVKQAAKLEELEALHKRMMIRVATIEMKIIEQKEKIDRHYKK